jgi:predicted porin
MLAAELLVMALAAAPGASPSAPPPLPASVPAADAITAPPWLEGVAERVDIYGRLDGHLAFSRDGVRVENNSSRFGVKVEQPVLGWLTLLGGGEWRVSLGKGDTTYNISENPDTGLATFQASTNQALSTRLGFVGVRFGDYGTLTLGKQWGVYYDVSRWTDVYTVFGAHGSSTYNAGTDGGQTGNGRADEALVYRVTLGPLRVGLQAQFLDATPNVVDGLAGSVVYRLGRSLELGAAYSYSFLDFGKTPIAGYDGNDSQALTAGISFEDRGWKVASVNTWTHDHELVKTPSAAVMYDTLGAELFASRRFAELVVLLAGFDLAVPRGLDTRFVNPNYGNRDVLFGARLLLDAKAGSFVYLEGRTGTTRDATGTRAQDVVTLGIRFNYSLRRAIGLEPLPEPRLVP